MIKASDLRIGNYYHGAYGINRVEGLTVDGVCEKGGKPICFVHPVPLTEDWLVRFGFVVSKDLGDLMLGPINFYREKRDYGCATKSSHFWLSSGGDDEFYDYPLTIEYVHQLQNLYYALTGEELVLKP